MAHVLIVDDEQDIRDTVRFILEDAGHQVQEASDGESALQIIRESPTPLVVLLDLLMPRLTGIDVLKAVTADPQMKKRNAFLLMTANSTNLRQQAEPFLHGLSAQVVSKPFDIDNLLKTVACAAKFQA